MNAHETASALVSGVSEVIKGKKEFIELLAAGLLAGGHILLEDNPGLGKTTVAKTIARLISRGGGGEGCDAAAETLLFKRIQFTPDLLPYDITGVDIYDPESRSFRFVPGPVLANIVLADEINRTTPKVQSALLEVMAERQVTVGAATYRPPEPFFVIATENPIESEGTFPLPAAQLDRFMMRLSLGYPDREAELAILESNPSVKALSELQPVITGDDFCAAREEAGKIFCHPSLKEALADAVRDTRIHKAFSLGASPRASLQFLDAVKALALLRGRDFVIDEDLSSLCVPVLAHRVRLRDPKAGPRQAAALVRELLLARLTRLEGIRV